MIESLSISGAPCFPGDGQCLSDLRRINFVFGANGSGKTTIARILANPENYPDCDLGWKGGRGLPTYVYGTDFVENNFQDLKGIFTLGADDKEAVEQIASLKTEIEALNGELERLQQQLGTEGFPGKRQELAALEDRFKDICWSRKLPYDKVFQKAFEKYRGSKQKFKDKIIEEFGRTGVELLDLSDLQTKAATVYAKEVLVEEVLAIPDFAPPLALEANAILQKQVVGKEDVNISEMIGRLGNSDWVREGRAFYGSNQGRCPFCQQPTTEEFARQLEDYFDEAYESAIDQIASLEVNYRLEYERVAVVLDSILAQSPPSLNADTLREHMALLDAKVQKNLQLIGLKRKEPSRKVALDSAADAMSAITAILEQANASIRGHNDVAANLSRERSALTAQIWKFMTAFELQAEYTQYRRQREALQKALDAIGAKVIDRTQRRDEIRAKIRRLEERTTSTQPTVDAINATLVEFGFNSFSLARANTGNSYRLVRRDGNDARKTLSEGERNFIAFLYFYHLLRGSNSETGTTDDRTVVFDDPVSSLDSDIFFIVSTLIRGIVNDARNGNSQVKQVFVFTHNVYFHKEVVFDPKRSGDRARKDETFWVVRKGSAGSMVERHETNPVRTSYQLLWDEVRREGGGGATLQNTLRRILENYFRIMGNVDFDHLCDQFVGQQKLLAKSLLSWVHDGSHYAHDDLYLSPTEQTTETYLAVFKDVFEKMHQAEHYKMMMGQMCDDPPEEEVDA